jgi:predicted site-specific integrase-resolvase
MPAVRFTRRGPEEILVYPDGTTNRAGIAIHFGVSRRTVDDWVASRKIPYQRRSARMLRFKIAEVQKALDKLNVRELAR